MSTKRLSKWNTNLGIPVDFLFFSSSSLFLFEKRSKWAEICAVQHDTKGNSHLTCCAASFLMRQSRGKEWNQQSSIEQRNGSQLAALHTPRNVADLGQSQNGTSATLSLLIEKWFSNSLFSLPEAQLSKSSVGGTISVCLVVENESSV